MVLNANPHTSGIRLTPPTWMCYDAPGLENDGYGRINEQREVLFLLLFLVGGGPTVAAR
jgi:hypothetical protein